MFLVIWFSVCWCFQEVVFKTTCFCLGIWFLRFWCFGVFDYLVSICWVFLIIWCLFFGVFDYLVYIVLVYWCFDYLVFIFGVFDYLVFTVLVYWCF